MEDRRSSRTCFGKSLPLSSQVGRDLKGSEPHKSGHACSFFLVVESIGFVSKAFQSLIQALTNAALFLLLTSRTRSQGIRTSQECDNAYSSSVHFVSTPPDSHPAVYYSQNLALVNADPSGIKTTKVWSFSFQLLRSLTRDSRRIQ